MKSYAVLAAAALALAGCSREAAKSEAPATPAPTAASDPVAYPLFSKPPHPGPPGPKTYPDRDGELKLPLGEASFADEVVSFVSGVPPAQEIGDRDAGAALGPPQGDIEVAPGQRVPSVALGCEGTLVLRFVDNALIDVPGPDLYVFEIGPAVEATKVAVSADNVTWLEVGQIAGGTASLDIGPAAQPGGRYHYIRLTDAKDSCDGRWPGADIDAVAAIGAALSISLDSSVLFDVDKAVLKPAATAELDRAAKALKAWSGKTVSVEGHTDSTGEPAHNLVLSQARAKAVRDYLAARPELAGKAVTATGFAATRPAASNADEAGRARNRRVEVILAPDR